MSHHRDRLIRARLGLTPPSPWRGALVEAGRLLVFVAAGLIFGALFLMSID